MKTTTNKTAQKAILLLSLCCLSSACSSQDENVIDCEPILNLNEASDCTFSNAPNQLRFDDPQLLCSPCKHIDGSLNIAPGDDLELLSYYNNRLVSISGDLTIENHQQQIISLDGFDQLQEVGGQLSISYNSRLNRIDGFSKLNKVAGLLVESNLGLTKIEGFGALESVQGQGIDINANPKLERIEGFTSLLATFRLGFTDNAGLTSLPSFEGLVTVAKSLAINRNPSLKALPAFTNLETVRETFSLKDNTSLSDCRGQEIVDGLETKPKTIDISGNGVCDEPIVMSF